MARAKKNDETDERAQAEKLRGRVSNFIGQLEQEAASRVAKASTLENERIKDLEQYHGRYDEDTRNRLIKSGGSQLFVPKTRPKTNAMSAKIMDILFPTDDRNWAIEPTPVPKMMGHNGGPAMAPEMPQSMPGQIAPAPEAESEDAATPANLMQEEIDDQLTECGYQAQCRDMIDDACKIGTGIMEGPVVNDNVRRGWSRPYVKGEDGKPVMGPDGKPQVDESGPYELVFGGDPRPTFYRIDPWSFFPDPDARTIEESESNYVRFLWKAHDLRKFAKVPEVDQDAIRDLLRLGATGTAPTYLTRVRMLTGTTAETPKGLYQVWKFCGALTADQMMDLAQISGDQGTMDDMAEVDPLKEVKAIIWFCQGRVLKFSIYPLDSGETTFSVFCLEKDEASIWGYGVPRMIRDPQKASNAAWRMLMDNGGLATGDQIIVNSKVIQPMDGSWTLTPRKFWELTEAAATNNIDVRTAFSNFAIDSHLDELSGIIELCDRQIDDGTALPMIQGENGAQPTNMPVGTMVLMTNAANIIFTRIIKNWDDDVTTPNIRRSYDWNMQHSPREEIKGDFDIKTRGASVLLIREMQYQNLMLFATTFGESPVWGKYLKKPKIAREIIRGFKLNHKEFIVSDEEAVQAEEAEAQAMAAAAGAGGPTADPAVEMRKLDLLEDEIAARIAIAEADRDSRERVAELNYDATMAKTAAELNVKQDALESKIASDREARMSKERTVAAEIAVRQQPQAPANETEIANS